MTNKMITSITCHAFVCRIGMLVPKLHVYLFKYAIGHISDYFRKMIIEKSDINISRFDKKSSRMQMPIYCVHYRITQSGQTLIDGKLQ